MRKIIHVDMDCFFAAVEMRDNPEYRHVPLAVGGTSNRGVIATCNYQARKFGVRSAMATSQALRLCPQLVLVKGRMQRYQEASAIIRNIFHRYTELVEPLSLDEAYLDVTDCPLYANSATRIAEAIRQDIFKETGLTASAGVANCKFVAKIASDENKPNGLCVVTPEAMDDFLAKLPLSKIPGVGKVTYEKLQKAGLSTFTQVREQAVETLVKRYGKFGLMLHDRAHGIDKREVKVSRCRKSVGVERTLSEDIHGLEDCEVQIAKLIDKLQQRLSDAHKQQGFKGQSVKLKFSDFRQTTVDGPFTGITLEAFTGLLREAFSRRGDKGIRLLGISLKLKGEQSAKQLDLPFNN